MLKLCSWIFVAHWDNDLIFNAKSTGCSSRLRLVRSCNDTRYEHMPEPCSASRSSSAAAHRSKYGYTYLVSISELLSSPGDQADWSTISRVASKRWRDIGPALQAVHPENSMDTMLMSLEHRSLVVLLCICANVSIIVDGCVSTRAKVEFPPAAPSVLDAWRLIDCL